MGSGPHEGKARLTDFSFRILETPQFQKDIQFLEKSGFEKISHKLQEIVYPLLRRHPHFGPHIKKLKGYEPVIYRYRIGDWRFLYQIDREKRIVLMESAAHRKEAYR